MASKLSRFAIAGSLIVVACGGNTSGNTNVQCKALTTTHASRPAGWGGTVFTIVMENHSRGDIVGSPDAPFINSLVHQNALAAGYHDSYVHPSEPNYIWMVAGENFDILSDSDPGPTQHISSTSHLADQIETAGLEWRAYAESMGQACDLTSHGTYAVKHTPFLFFDDLNGWNGTSMPGTDRCRQHVVDYSQFAGDLASGHVADYVFITPDLSHDMHDGSIAAGDAWLAQEVPQILSSPAFNNGGVLYLLWDEGGGYPPTDDPPFIAISPNAKHDYVSNTTYDTSSFLATVELSLGLDVLPCSNNPTAVHAMTDLFTTPM